VIGFDGFLGRVSTFRIEVEKKAPESLKQQRQADKTRKY